MRAVVVLGLVFSIPSQEIGLGKRLRNDLFCVEWDSYNQSLARRHTLTDLLLTSSCWMHVPFPFLLHLPVPSGGLLYAISLSGGSRQSLG